MKLHRLISPLLTLTAVLTLHLAGTAFAQSDTKYGAKLISPRPGQVLQPGQVVRIQWTATFPNVDLSMCETEVLLSLDGGKTIYTMIWEQRNPRIQYFDWTVPNLPTSQAVLDIRFGCLNIYPESASLQLQSPFVIGSAPAL